MLKSINSVKTAAESLLLQDLETFFIKNSFIELHVIYNSTRDIKMSICLTIFYNLLEISTQTIDKVWYNIYKNKKFFINFNISE